MLPTQFLPRRANIPKLSHLTVPTARSQTPHTLLQRQPTHAKRTLTSTSRSLHPVANPVSRPDLLQRNPDRDLPTLASLNPTRKWLTTLPIFIAIITISALGIFNYQKVNSPIITATLYSLRTNPTVRQELGDEVYFASKWAWVWGTINLVQGKVDVKFSVKGTREKGWCRFRAKRLGGKGGTFKTYEWSLTLDDGRVIQLLDPNRDPLSGAAL